MSEPQYEYRVVCPDGKRCGIHVDFPAFGLAENDDVHCTHDEPGSHRVERRPVGAWEVVIPTPIFTTTEAPE